MVKLAPATTRFELILQWIGVGVVYFFGGFLVDLLQFEDGTSNLIWPSAGLALAAVVLLGYRVWPGIAIGQTMLFWYHGAPPILLLGIIPGPVLQALVGARLILGKRGIHPEIRSVRFAVWFVLMIVILCSLISSTFSVSAKYLSGDIDTFAAYIQFLWKWGMGDALGIIICYPFVMNWVPHVGARRDFRPMKIEDVGALVLLLAVSLVVYDPFRLFVPEFKALAFLPLPIIMWIALRQGMRAASLSMVIVSIVITWGTATDGNTVPDLQIANRMAVDVGYVFVLALSTLMASASTEEHVNDHLAVEESERFSRRILDTTPNVIYVYDLLDERNVYANQKITEVLGYSRSQIREMGGEFYKKLIHPEDFAKRPELNARWRTATDADLFTLDYRMKGADGTWRWFQETNAVFKRDANGAVIQMIGNARDVTESRLAQEQARIDSAFNQSIVANAGEGICVCTEVPEFPFVSFSVWNDEMISVTGYSVEEINQLGWYQCMYPDPDVQQRAIARMQRMRTGDNMSAEQWEITRKDGTKRQLLITTSIVMSNAGVPNVLGVMSDVTSRIEAAAAIERLEDLYRKAIAAANGVPYMQDHASDEFTFIGDGIFQVTGYTGAEMSRSRWEQIAETSILRGPLSHLGIEEAVRRARDGEVSQWQCDTLIRTKSGEHRWLADCAVEVPGENGKPTGSIGILLDITDRKRAEEALSDSEARFRAFLDNSPAFAFMKDTAGRYVVGNRAWAQQFDLPMEELLGKTDDELWDTETAETFQRSDADATQANGSIGRIERVRGADGTECWLSVLKFPVRGFGGEELIGGIALDVTEQKLAERKIQQLNEELEDRVRERTNELNHRVEDVERLNRDMVKVLEDLESARASSDESASKLEIANRQLKAINEELEAFSYSISHDLRAPLRHIHGFVRLLQKEAGEKLSDVGRHQMEIIAESATRMGRLIDDLLAFSRSGRSELKKSQVSLDQLVREVVADLDNETNKRKIEWRIAALPDVLGDTSLLRQVFVNLVSNAVKYSSRVEHAVIAIGTEPSDEPEMTGFFIRDNGAGFDMKYADKLFGVFQRLHRQNEFEGTGIGLANVLRILHRHGGQIRAEAALHQGATFHFTLPSVKNA